MNADYMTPIQTGVYVICAGDSFVTLNLDR